MLSEMSTEKLEESDPSSASAIDSNVSRKRTFDESLKNEKNPSSIGSIVGLPRELTDKFGPLLCKLCNITASSNVSAKVHYAGKPHRKNIKKFLDEWCKRTGEPMPKLSKPEETQMRQDVTYCSICKLVLTSVSNAQEHYAGKNHFKAVRRSYTTLRVDSKPVLPPAAADPTGRFGIGVGFLKPEENPQPQEPQPKVELKPDKKNLWICELCNVRTHTEEQLKIHLGGSKHIKAVKRSQAPSVVPAPVNPSESILASVIRPESGGTDYSMHRTPSGNYYCQCCNVTLNSSEQFGQHIESKKHKFKYASLRKPMNRNDKVPS